VTREALRRPIYYLEIGTEVVQISNDIAAGRYLDAAADTSAAVAENAAGYVSW